MNGASDYLGWVILGTVGFVVISIAYEAIKKIFQLRRK